MLRVVAPWSLANFIPLNGFHPLYRSITSHGNADVCIEAPRNISHVDYNFLLESKFFDTIKDFPPPPWLDGELKSAFDAFCKQHNAVELAYLSNLAGDVELLHTAPVTRADRPFFLHAESFMPIFFPFLKQGHGAPANLSRIHEVRVFYARLFESPMCLGIASHLPTTLNQLSDFFQSSAIDAKLVQSPIGLDNAYISPNCEKGEETRFIFLTSANQGANGFSLRGGVLALRLALTLLRTRQQIKFLFRCARPADSWLSERGIPVQELRTYESNEIVWLESYLPDEAINCYLSRSHFLLLASANLHSVSILSALANGVIPIVTDTIGTDIYVEHGQTGIVLKGVRAAAWSADTELRLVSDDHTKFLQLQDRLFLQLESEVRHLLSAPEKMKEIAEKGRAAVRLRFNGKHFSRWMVSEVTERFGRSRVPRENGHRSLAGALWLEPVTDSHFTGPIQPIRWLNTGTAQIVRLGQQFIYAPFACFHEMDNSACWSPLNLARHERHSIHGSRDNLRRFASNRAAVTWMACQRPGDERAPSGERIRHLPMIVAERLKHYPIAYSAARRVWRLYRRVKG